MTETSDVSGDGRSEASRDARVDGSPNELTETIELVRRFQRGDEAVLNPLFQRLYPRVLSYVRIRMGSALKQRVGVENVVQETMLATFLALKQFEGRENAEFVRYLATITERKIIAAAKRTTIDKRDVRLERSMQQVQSMVSTWGGSAQLPASDTAPLDRMLRAEEREILDECIASLKPDYRDVILQRDIAGASLDDAARVLGRETPQAVSMLHARATISLTKAAKERGLI
ncbi:MAG: RNA polymerase sigma factor [Planctomycetota bacterium]